MIIRCVRCDDYRCTDCTPPSLCGGCHDVPTQVKVCLDCEGLICTFCSEFGACKECLGAICEDCYHVSNRSPAAGACKPCFSPPPPKEPEEHPLPPGFSVYDRTPYNEAELKMRTGGVRRFRLTPREWKKLDLKHDPVTGRFLKKGEEPKER